MTAMKSTLLAARLRGIFGADGEAQLERLLSEAAPSHPVLVDGVRRLQGAGWPCQPVCAGPAGADRTVRGCFRGLNLPAGLH